MHIRPTKRLSLGCKLLNDDRQEQLFLATVGGGAATVKLAHQLVGDRRRGKPL